MRRGIDPEPQKCWLQIEIEPKYEREEHKLQRNAKYGPQRKLHVRGMHLVLTQSKEKPTLSCKSLSKETKKESLTHWKNF